MTIRFPAYAVSLTAAVLVAACSAGPVDTVAQPPRIGHIHGLAINPSDQSLYAATHYGLYRFGRDGAPELVGGHTHDFMGFTVIGADHFLASGHPGATDPGQLPHLGLIESTNGGRNWTNRSLPGEADFHSVQYRHGRVYAYDSLSGRVMISAGEDGWDRRAEIAALSIAVSPTNREEILATTAEAGLMRSLDGGATFTTTPSASPLVYLGWPDDGPLIGVDPAGTLRSSLDGTTWKSRHALGESPQALLAAGDGQVVVATDSMIYRSTDNGTTAQPYRRMAEHTSPNG
ncbi:hypothetical protein A5759_02925 [Mycobacterium sp. 852014-52144_SCH5372336]|nr:hypothetical protein A5759_02925 [Mycobacterium sp. 852014-52144_SCH5372336]